MSLLIRARSGPLSAVIHDIMLVPEAPPLAVRRSPIPNLCTVRERLRRRAGSGAPKRLRMPVSDTWKRRAGTIPAMLATTAAALVLAPFVVAGAVLWDTVHSRRRYPTLRIYLFACQYVINDSAEIALAAPLWLASGCGRWSHSEASRRRYQRVQAWSIDVLARRAETLLGVRLAVEPTAIAPLVAPPVIVVARHVSMLDTALPSLLCQRAGYHSSGVIMAELLADPGFDLLYQHAGSVFIGRDSDPAARDQIAAFGQRLDAARFRSSTPRVGSSGRRFSHARSPASPNASPAAPGGSQTSGTRCRHAQPGYARCSTPCLRPMSL
jgi:hypothetical protein